MLTRHTVRREPNAARQTGMPRQDAKLKIAAKRRRTLSRCLTLRASGTGGWLYSGHEITALLADLRYGQRGPSGPF